MIATAETNLKRVTLELGGKSPAVVFGDAGLEKAVPAVSQAIFALTGQVCVGTSRVLVEESIVDDVVSPIFS